VTLAPSTTTSRPSGRWRRKQLVRLPLAAPFLARCLADRRRCNLQSSVTTLGHLCRALASLASLVVVVVVVVVA
jgi:hypothetical protein